MKKLVLLTAVAALGLASCKSNYSCDCTIGGVTTEGADAKLSKSEAEDAEAACNAADALVKFGGGDDKCEWVKG